ncbi:MAG: tetratricopeptide repeat protein [Planctomycetota bacterium]|jgi:tetratricopeptide (TPR) repeat protein
MVDLQSSLRCRPPAAAAILASVTLMLAIAGCDDTDPARGQADGPVPPTAAAPAALEPAAPDPAPDPAPEPDPTEGIAASAPPEALPPELAEIFRLIEQYRTGPARVRLVKYGKLHPDDGVAAFLFGLTYHREKRYEKALSHYEQAVSLEPDYTPTYHFLGWATYYLGRAEASRAAFERHLASHPDVADSHFGLGLVDLDQDRLDDAEQRFRTAIRLQEEGGSPARPRDLAKAYAQLGEIFALRGSLEEARTALEHAVDLFPDHYEAHYRLYRVLLQLGEEAAAQQALERHEAAKKRVRPGTRFPE